MRDLLYPTTSTKDIAIRERADGTILLAGVKEETVLSLSLPLSFSPLFEPSPDALSVRSDVTSSIKISLSRYISNRLIAPPLGLDAAIWIGRSVPLAETP